MTTRAAILAALVAGVLLLAGCDDTPASPGLGCAGALAPGGGGRPAPAPARPAAPAKPAVKAPPPKKQDKPAQKKPPIGVPVDADDVAVPCDYAPAAPEPTTTPTTREPR